MRDAESASRGHLLWVASSSGLLPDQSNEKLLPRVLPEILGWRDSILLRPLYGTRHGCPSTKNVPPAKDTWVPSGRIPPLANLLETLSSILCVLQCNIASISSSDSSHFGVLRRSIPTSHSCKGRVLGCLSNRKRVVSSISVECCWWGS